MSRSARAERDKRRTPLPRRLVLLSAVIAALLFLLAGCTAFEADPEWIREFGYSLGEVHAIEIGDRGFPYIRVRVGDRRLHLPFDTGNMVGISLSSELFDDLGLPTDDEYVRRDSAGEVVGRLRTATSVPVSVLGRKAAPTRVFELNDDTVPGLVGPDIVGSGHFTLDYRARRMALGSSPLPGSLPGFQTLPLVRSPAHPGLVLVYGTVEGCHVLIELDTGKSRTVINPGLAAELGLERVARGVAIRRLTIGELSFEVPSAKEVDQTAIDPDLPEPILLGIGSDLLSQFVWTVDYDAGLLWLPTSITPG